MSAPASLTPPLDCGKCADEENCPAGGYMYHVGERPALLWMTGWAGLNSNPVFVVGETPKRYRIRADKRTRLGGRMRWLEPGETALVPKWAVTFPKGEA